MTSQPRMQKIAMHILPNISRSNGNQTMKFGQLIEYNMRNIFLEKSHTTCGGDTIPRPFSKKLKLSISLDQQSKVLQNLFLLLVMLKVTFGFTSNKALSENRKRSGISLPDFLHDFRRKIFLSSYIILIDLNFFVWLSVFWSYWAICLLKLFANQVLTS